MPEALAEIAPAEKEKRIIRCATKLTRSECAELEAFAGQGVDVTDSEWVRHALLTLARQPQLRESVDSIRKQTLTMHTFVVNLLDWLVAGKPVTQTTVSALFAKAKQP